MKLKFRIISFVISVSLLIVFAAIGFAIRLLPDYALTYDMSDDGFLAVSDEAKKFLSGVDTDVTVYLLAAEGITDPQFDLQLSQIEAANSRIKVKTVNTTANPDFIKDYTDTELGDYSLVVKSEKRFTVVDSMPFYDYKYSPEDGTGLNMTYAEYSRVFAKLYSAYSQAYSYYGDEELADEYCEYTYQMSFTDFNQNTDINNFRGCEGMLLGAIEYVTKDTVPTLYALSGHSEQLISSVLKDSVILPSGYELGDSLNLSKAGKIPTDASAIIILSPVEDISESEADMLIAYVANGGSVFLATSPELIQAQPNLASVAGSLGLSAISGTVCDSGEDCNYNTVKNVIPSYNTDNLIGKSLSDMQCLILTPNAHGIKISDTLPKGVTASAIARSSDASYLVSNNKKLTDANQAYDLAVSAENASGGKLVWFGSADCFTDTYSYITNYNNYYAFQTVIQEIAEVFTPTNEITYTKTADDFSLTVAESDSIVWLVIIAIAIPLLLSTVAFAAVYRRKHLYSK